MFPCLFCFPKSHINKNGGKFVAVSCKKSKKYCCVLLPFLDLRGGCPCAAPISAKYKQNQRQQNQFAKTKIKTGDPQCANIISLCPSITCKLCLSNGSRLSSCLPVRIHFVWEQKPLFVLNLGSLDVVETCHKEAQNMIAISMMKIQD